MKTMYKPEDFKNMACEENLFGVTIPADSCATFSRGWQPEEVEKITVIFRKPDTLKLDTIENGKLVAAVIDDEQTARLVYYVCNGSGEIVLTDPNSYVYPYDRGESPVVIPVAEAATRLNILGVAEKFYMTLKTGAAA